MGLDPKVNAALREETDEKRGLLLKQVEDLNYLDPLRPYTVIPFNPLTWL